MCERLAAVRALRANASPELRYLVDAMRRAAECSFANRRGEPYYLRKRRIYGPVTSAAMAADLAEDPEFVQWVAEEQAAELGALTRRAHR